MYRQLLSKVRDLRKSFSSYNPHIQINVSEDNILHNLHEYQKLQPKVKFSPVLKSNAYGHGLVGVARILDSEDLPFFVVDSLFEAKLLRGESIKTNILIVGYVSPENIVSSKITNTAFTITSLEQLAQISKIINKPLSLHIKVDTGMHRQGIVPNEVNDCVTLLKSNENLMLEGVCTHLSDADGDKKDYSLKQIKAWEKVVVEFKQNFDDVKFFHMAASAGSYFASDATNNVARLGLGLYGINTSPHLQLKLKPALEMKSVISSIRDISAGDEVGYSRTFKASTDMKIATVPVGYFEGVDRRLSNKGFFVVSGKACPIVGRVSMNITSIDVSEVRNIKLGDEVVVISINPSDTNSVENISQLTDTIAYESLVRIPQHLKRIVV